MTRLRAGSATDVGLVRSTNQDQLLVASALFAVADGMGGHAAGEVASRVAVEALGQAVGKLKVVTAKALKEAARDANRAVWERAQTDPELRGMGTTLVAMALVDGEGDEEMAVVNVGDSRAYRLRDGRLEQLTVDHSLVQELVDEGQLRQDEAAYHPQRHVLTRALGVDPEVAVDVMEVTPAGGDRFLLCSDGLVREVGDDQVASVLRRLDDPDDAARELVQQAKEHGGSDNITVVVVDVADDQDGSAADTTVLAAPPRARVGGDRVGGDRVGGDRVGGDRVGGDRVGGDRVGGDRGKVPAPPPEPPPPPRRRRPSRARAAPLTRFITVRVVLFCAVFVAVLAIAAAGVVWYARGTYYVGLSGNRLTIFQGHPGGLLWFRPTVAQRTDVTTDQILSYHLAALRSGQQEATFAAARQYVQRLESEYAQASGG